MDLSENCIDACRERFASSAHIAYHVNDGKTLEFIPDGSVDFIFSFDSLVHAEEDVIEAYLRQFPRVLTRGGVAFIHHSNLAECRPNLAERALRMRKVGGALRRLGLRPRDTHWRAPTMSAERFSTLSVRNGLRCLSQEIVNWGGELLNDCFSLVARDESPWPRRTAVLRNRSFMAEAAALREISTLYGAASLTATPEAE